MLKLLTTFADACLSHGIANFYCGDPQMGILEKYIPTAKSFSFVGKAENFPFVSLNIINSTRYFDKKSREYSIDLCYGNLIPSDRINTILSIHEAEDTLLSIYNKAKTLSNENSLLITNKGNSYSFDYANYLDNSLFFLTILSLEIITAE